MWLINTKTMKLESFHNPSTLEYAILSHTWGDEEVTFQDWQQMKSGSDNGAILKKKQGYSKIEMTCHMARGKKLEYAWIDTCCIDKSSSSELSEAINSMLNWYRCSKICFAYLSDCVCPVPIEGSLNIKPVSPIETDLYSCRWFRRGWTLQELIAPQKVVFFDCKWKEIGEKSELIEMLSEITGIDAAVLTGHQRLDEVSVAQRMSWAAHRETTRIEDCAYCLLGIFDVNMHSIYGEGDKAFLRLQAKILKQCNDLSLFAWAQNRGPKRYGEIFAISPTHFAECSKMKCLAQTQRRRKEFTFTNNGLMVDAVFERDQEKETCYLDLDTWDGTEGSEGWVYVELIRKGDIYVRRDSFSLRTVKSRLLWAFPYCEVRPICIETTSQSFEDPLWLFPCQLAIEIICERSLRNMMTWTDNCYGKGAEICLSSATANRPNHINTTVAHTLAGNWLAIFPFTLKSSCAGKHIKVAVVCGNNSVRELRTWRDPVYETWVGLFGEPFKGWSCVYNTSTTIADLSHDPTLEESEVLEGIEDILFSRFSNNLGQVLGSKLPKEFTIPDGDPSPNGSYDRIFLTIEFGDAMKISVQRERISVAPTENRNRRKRLRRL